MGDGCCSEKYEMGECCQEKAGCGGNDSSCCSDSSCGPKGGHNGYCDMSYGMRALADRSWECLMKEKIKKAYEAKMGKHMDELAQICADHSIKMHELKNQGHGQVASEIEAFRKKLTEAMQKK
ncbi:MAG: hypothetical protein V1822_01045 [Candidatus Micrarchaeota archaeon]